MPKIFLIKNRLHQQQLRLLESQNLIQSKTEDRLNIGDGSQHDDREPLSLVAKKRNTEDNSASGQHSDDETRQRNDSGEFENSRKVPREGRKSFTSSYVISSQVVAFAARAHQNNS